MRNGNLELLFYTALLGLITDPRHFSHILVSVRHVRDFVMKSPSF